MPAWSGLFDGFYRVPYAMQFTKDRSPRSQVALQFLHRGMKKDLALITALLGAAAGGTATSTYKRVYDSNLGPSDLYRHGGKQTVETVTEVNRVTTSADTTELLAYVLNYNHNLTLKTDSGGNSIHGDPGRL